MEFNEKFTQGLEEAEKKKRKEAGDQEVKTDGPALNKILANPEEQRLFELYLEGGTTEQDKELALKMMAGNLEVQDLDVLDKHRLDFLEMRERAKNLEQLIKKNLDRIITASPDLEKISHAVGPEGIKNALISRLDELVITDADRFLEMEDQFKALAGEEKTIAENNEEIAKFCKENGIRENDYLKALITQESGDSSALENFIKEKKLIKGFNRDKKMAEKLQELDISGALKENKKSLENSLAEVGGSMVALFAENEIAKKALNTVFKNERPEQVEPVVSLRDIKETLNTRGSKDDMRNEWSEYKNLHQNDQGYDEATAVDTFSKDYVTKNMPKKKRGLFGMLFASIFASSVKDAIK